MQSPKVLQNFGTHWEPNPAFPDPASSSPVNLQNNNFAWCPHFPNPIRSILFLGFISELAGTVDGGLSNRPGISERFLGGPVLCTPDLRDGPNTVSESTVSNTKLSDLFCPHRVPGRELSEFLSGRVSAYYLCDSANSPSLSQNSPSLPQNSVRLSEFSSPKQYSRNSIPPVS